MKTDFMKSLLVVGAALFMWGMPAQAQCFDLSQIGDWETFRCIDYNFKVTNKTGEKEIYTWVASKAPEDHPRHTLMTEQGKDSICPDLNVLPPEGGMSVRLASTEYAANDSAQGMATAHYLVISADAPIIKFRYAAVMDNPKHELASNPEFYMWAQPNFDFRIYRVADNTQQLVDCSLREYYMSVEEAMKGWKEGFSEAAEGEEPKAYMWKDWTTVSIDLSKYAGEKVIVFISAYDCAESAYDSENEKITICKERELIHLYYTLSCDASGIDMKQDCSDGDKTTLSVSEDLNSFRWFKKDNADNTLSTEHTITFDTPKTPQTNQTYCCEVEDMCGKKTFEYEVYATQIFTEKKSLPYGETYTWSVNDSTYTKSAKQTITVPHKNYDCDSIVYKLDLSIKADSCDGRFALDKKILCPDVDTVVKVIPTYDFGGINEYDIKFDQNALNVGFKDIKDGAFDDNGDIVIPLPVKYSEEIDENGVRQQIKYTKPGDYSFTLVERNTCEEQKEHKLTFTVNYPKTVIYQRWNDVLLIQNEKFNGGYKISEVSWYKNKGIALTGHGERGAYYYASNQFGYTVGDEYYAKLTREDDGVSVCTCGFTPVLQTGDSTLTKVNFEYEVQASSAPARMIIMHTNENAAYSLYNITGMLVSSGYINADKNQNVTLPVASAGTYIIRFRTDDGYTRSEKLILR